MRLSRTFLLCLVSSLAAGLLGLPAQSAHARSQSNFGLPRDIALPSTLTLAVYLPAHARESRFFVQDFGYWTEPGRALERSVQANLKAFVAAGFIVDRDSTQAFGLLLAVQPKLQVEGGTLRQTLKYKVLGPNNAVLLQGEQTAVADVGDLRSADGVYNATLKALRLALVDVFLKLRPDEQRYPPTMHLTDIAPAAIVDHGTAVASGTGFFINPQGQVLTAAHVLQNCMLVDVKRDDKVLASRVRASSDLLDLAVIDTGTQVANFLPFRRRSELNLGEPVSNVGFPLQTILAGSPNLTRGNVSSRGALAGSVGQFQFSAPIQPGSSGGPVVSDGGELLGITVATLNVSVKKLIETGMLPQNVNFALDAKYAAMFLRRNDIAFTEVEPNPKGDMSIGNQAALSTVVSLNCYQ